MQNNPFMEMPKNHQLLADNLIPSLSRELSVLPILFLGSLTLNLLTKIMSLGGGKNAVLLSRMKVWRQFHKTSQ